MRAINRQLVCGFLSLLLVLSGQVSASSQTMASSTGMPESDCGSVHKSEPSRLDDAQQQLKASPCIDSPSVACFNSGGISQCVITFVFIITKSISLPAFVTVPALSDLGVIYQNPFLESMTPPPQLHS